MTTLAALVAADAQSTLGSRTGAYYLPDYYQVGDGTVPGTGGKLDYLPAFQRIQALLTDNVGAVIQVPLGDFYLSSTFNVWRPIRIVGTGMGNQPATCSTRLIIPANTTGLRLWNDVGETGAVAAGVPANGCASTFAVEQIGIFCLDTTTSGIGVHATTAPRIYRCNIQGFGGDGVRIRAYSQAELSGANCWVVSDCVIRSNKGYGLYVEGADANAGVAIMIYGGNNTLGDFYDASQLGNTYIALQSDASRKVAYTDLNGTSFWLGCYNENAGGATNLHAGALLLGGVLTSGFNMPKLGVYDRVTRTTSATFGASVTTITVPSTAGYVSNATSGGWGNVAITGTNIPANTTVVAILSGTTLQISQPTTGSASGTYTITPPYADDGATGGGIHAQVCVVACDGSGTVTKVLPIYYGSGYTAETVVQVDLQGAGSGFALTPNIVSGHITSYTITNGGSGYSAGLGTNTGLIQSTTRGGLSMDGSFTSNNYNPSSSRYLTGNVCYNGNHIFTGRVFNNSSSDLEEVYTPLWDETYKTYNWYLSSAPGAVPAAIRLASSYGTNLTMGRSGAIPAGSMQFPMGYWLGGGATGSFQTAGRYVGNDTAAPTTGQWAKGDIIWNTAPSAGGSMGWMCTTTGDFAGSPTPVFKAMPNLAA